MGFTNRIKNHPTVLMLRLLVGLELTENNQNDQTSLSKKLIRHPLVLFIGFVLSLFLLAIFLTAKPNNSNITSVNPTNSPAQVLESDSISTNLETEEKETNFISANLDSNDKETVLVIADKAITKTVSEVTADKNIVQMNSQRIDKLELLLLQEQKKNKELYQKLSTRDVQLQEFKAIAMKDIIIGNKDQKYITAITEKDNTIISDETKLTKIDYYNKVRVLLKSELGSHANDKQNTQLQKLVNQLLNTKDRSSKVSKETKYTKSLEKESTVRHNEVRSIILKKNETLWGLAKRAYGKGILYKKIIKANPQISEENARFLQPGTFIRIPE